jgi:hypothetical protein
VTGAGGTIGGEIFVPSYQRTPGTAIGIPQPALAPSGVQLAIVPVANRRASRRRGLGWLHAPTAARKT